ASSSSPPAAGSSPSSPGAAEAAAAASSPLDDPTSPQVAVAVVEADQASQMSSSGCTSQASVDDDDDVPITDFIVHQSPEPLWKPGVGPGGGGEKRETLRDREHLGDNRRRRHGAGVYALAPGPAAPCPRPTLAGR
ncbi:hypothetical protein CRUP_021990, partial [Coryphaenoides rupestris]